MLSENLRNYAKSEADQFIRMADVLYVLCDIQQDKAIVKVRYMNGAYIETVYEE